MAISPMVQGHIIIGIVQIITVIIQTIFHKENKKSIAENKKDLNEIKVVLKLNGFCKLEKEEEKKG